MRRRRLARWVVPILASCLALRIGLLLWAPVDYQRNPLDIDGWGGLGRSIADGKGLSIGSPPRPTALRGPVYPALLGLIFLSADALTAPVQSVGPTPDTPTLQAALAAQALLDTLSCWLVYLLARRTVRSRPAALIAAGLWALYLPGATLVTRLWSEPCFTVIVLAGLLGMTWAATRAGWRWLVPGAVFGLSSLCRPAGVAIGAGLAVYCFTRRRIKGYRWAGVQIIAGMAVVLAPWVLRNAVQFYAFIPLTTHGGFSLWESTFVLDEDRSWWRVTNPYVAIARLRALRGDPWPDPRMSEPDRDRVYRTYAHQAIVRHPVRFALTCFLRLTRSLFNVGFGHWPSPASWCVALYHAALLTIAGLGIARTSSRNRPEIGILWVAPAANLVLHTLVVGFARYMFPTMGTVMILAAMGLLSLGSPCVPPTAPAQAGSR